MTLRVRLLFLVLNLTLRAYYCSANDEDNADGAVLAPRVTGGEEAPIGRFPYMCSLRERGRRVHRCGGTLIRSQWVLTAAHCIDPEHRNSVGLTPVVYCGAHTSETNDPDLVFNAVDGYMHISWTGDVNNGFDVGLLKLDRESNATLPAVDSYQTPLSSGDLLTALGWGSTDSQETASVLQMAENLLYLPPARCESQLGNVFQPQMICAGLLDEDTCRGDSGGPLLIPDKPQGNLTAGLAQTDLIIGVTSSGPEACDGSFPGVYTRISDMWEWILSVLDGEASIRESSQGLLPTDSVEETAPPPETPAAPEASVTSVENGERDEDVAFGPEASTATNLRLEEVISLIEDDSAGVLEAILSEGLDPNSRHNDSSFQYGVDNDTLLHWAARFDSVACVEVLIDGGAELEAKNLHGETPLHINARFGTTAAAEVLIEQGADVHATDDRGHSPLHFACFYGNVATVQLLLRQGADVDAVDDGEETPLHESARTNRSRTAQILLDNDADIEAKENEGLTPLQFASIYGSAEAAEVLLENGAEVDSRSDLGTTPLQEACIAGYDKVVTVLIERGADVNVTDNFEETPLHGTARFNHPDIVEILLINGADIEAKEDEGLTPLHFASIYGSAEAAEALLENGAEVDARSDSGTTPLHEACIPGHLDVVNVLLSYDTNINAVDDTGETPLHDASRRGRLNIARILVEAGASKEAIDDNGNTPRDVRCSHKKADCSRSTKRSLKRLLSP